MSSGKPRCSTVDVAPDAPSNDSQWDTNTWEELTQRPRARAVCMSKSMVHRGDPTLERARRNHDLADESCVCPLRPNCVSEMAGSRAFPFVAQVRALTEPDEHSLRPWLLALVMDGTSQSNLNAPWIFGFRPFNGHARKSCRGTADPF